MAKGKFYTAMSFGLVASLAAVWPATSTTAICTALNRTARAIRLINMGVYRSAATGADRRQFQEG